MEGLSWWRMRLSYRNATIVVCFLNIVAATFLFWGFFSYADKRIARANQPNLAQMRYIIESEQIRRSMEPLELIKRVSMISKIKEIKEEEYTEPGMETKQVPKQTAAVDLSKRLNDLRAMNDANSLKALEEWRRRKMERARQREIERNTTITSQT